MDGWSWVLGPFETGKAPRKEGQRLSQILQNVQQTFAQAALFPTLAWPKLGVSDTSFELFPTFLIHFSLTGAITVVQPDRVLPQAYASPGAALLMLYLGTTHVRPGPAGALTSHVADL